MPPEALPGLVIDWPAPQGVRAFMSTRDGGISQGPFASLNLGAHVGDDADAVEHNRARLARQFGSPPLWLEQVHGARVVDARLIRDGLAGPADAAVALEPGLACAVLVADCLPVLLCSRDGRVVAAAHAGWRGLAAGVLASTVGALIDGHGCHPRDILAWLGPCIGPLHFEVGHDVREAFGAPGAVHFEPKTRADGTPGWRCDLPGLARQQLAEAGVEDVHGGHWCTVARPSDFFSFRRDRICGRMAAVICSHR